MTRVVVGLGFAVLAVPVCTLLGLAAIPPQGLPPSRFAGGNSYSASPRVFERTPVGPQFLGLPQITNVQILDLNGDGHSEILACDAARNGVFAYFRNLRDGSWREEIIGPTLPAPAHATVVDIDADGDLDLVVSVLGNIEPDDGVIGRLVVLEQTAGGYVEHVVLDDVRRVADAQPADFDGDGDLDLAVAVFGYSRGSVLWLENHGNWRFEEHLLLTAPGTIHVPVADFDLDGDLDFCAIVSQDEEEIWGFENLGGGEFSPRKVFQSLNFDLGSAGLVKSDLDNDGDMDLVLPVGDNLEDLDAYPQPYHGCLWFENLGPWKFREHRISDLGGTYAADVGDLDGDGDRDVVLVSMTNDWHSHGQASLVWLENDGHQQFRTWQIDGEPTHLVTVAAGDLDGDGNVDLVAGGLHVRPPYDRLGRITAWMSRKAASP